MADAGGQSQLRGDIKCRLPENCRVTIYTLLIGEPNASGPAGDRETRGQRIAAVVDDVVLQNVVQLTLQEHTRGHAESILLR